MNKKALNFIALFLFTTVLSISAQTINRQQTLLSILKKLELKYGYSFSYLDKDIKGIKIYPPEIEISFEESLSYLEKATPFSYIILDASSVAIQLKTKQFQICGELYTEDLQPITDATIKSSRSKVIRSENGAFTLSLQKSDTTITIDALGYKSRILQVSKFEEQGCTQIIMIPKIETLSKIIINNFLVKGISKNRDGSVTVDFSDFAILPGLIEPDFLQTIQALPGIISVNESVSDINIRGGTNDQNLILWDGIKMYQSSHFFGLISAFNPYLTKNVTISKNGSPAHIGDGVSGVISMHTDSEITNRLKTGIGLNMISADAYTDIPIGSKSSIQLSGRHSLNGLVETYTYNRYFDKAFQESEIDNDGNSDSNFNFSDASVRWLYQHSPRDLIRINGLFLNNKLIFKENEFNGSEKISLQSSARQQNIATGIYYRRNWSPKLQSEIQLYGTNYTLESINSNIIDDQRLLQKNDVLENGMKGQIRYEYSPRWKFSVGYQFNETGITNVRDLNNPTFFERIKNVMRTQSAFSEINLQSQDSTVYLNLGVRSTYFDKLKRFRVEPRLSLQKKFPFHITFEILGELKSQSVSQQIDVQNDFLGIENRRWILSDLGDPNNLIPLITSAQASWGLRYQRKGWLISSDFFYKEVQGITTTSQGFQNQYEFIFDDGSYQVYGMDFLVNKQFRNLNAWFSYSFADNSYKFNNLDVTSFPNNLDVRHTITAAIAYTLSDFKFSAGTTWHSGKPVTRPEIENTIMEEKIEYQNPNNDRLRDYLRLDASMTYQFPVSKKVNALAGISVWNIFDRNNPINTYYQLNDDENDNKIEETNEIGLRFTPNAVFRITF